MKILSFLLLLSIAFIASCGNSQNEEIEKLLDTREKAFETQDVDLYMTLIDPDYSVEKDNKVFGLEEVKKGFLSNVTLFDDLKISHASRSIYERGDTTEAVQLTVVDASVNESKTRFKVNERIKFSKIDGKWLIVEESDADFLERFVFGGSN
ncbi:MAG: hypothetical protein AAF462_09410 [Thermodesulfobacteriota bacterium]